MSYYNNCRDHEKQLRRKSKSCYKYSEKQREIDLKKLGDPLQFLQVTGRSCTLHKNPRIYEKIANRVDFIAWNGDSKNLIDKYDCRALLDFIPSDLKKAGTNSPQSDETKETNSLLNYERYRSLLLHIESGKSDKRLLHKVRLVLAARNVKMHHITEKRKRSDSEESCEFILNKTARKKTDRLARKYGVLGFAKIEEFNSVEEHNQKVIKAQKEKAKFSRDIRLGEVPAMNRRKRRNVLNGVNKRSFIEVSSDEERYRRTRASRSESYHSSSYYDSDADVRNKHRLKAGKASRGKDESVKALIATLDDLAEEKPISSQQIEPFDSEELRKPSTSTMKRFFPDMTPVDSVEEAMNWTNADFQRRKGLGGTKETESPSAGRRERTPFVESKERVKKRDVSQRRKREVEENEKKTPSLAEKMRLKMRQAFKKNISRDKLETQRREEKRREEGRRRENDLDLLRKKYSGGKQ